MLFTQVGAKQRSILVERSDSHGMEDTSDGGGSLNNSSNSLATAPSANVKLKLRSVMQKALAYLPESPHNKIAESYGNEFPIFLRFKGRTRLATWHRFDTMVDLQNSFFEAFHFPERVLHAFLLNKARLEIVSPKKKRGGGRRDPPQLLSVLSQMHPGIIIEAHSDVWDAWYKHVEGGGKLVRRLSLHTSKIYEPQRTLSKKMDRILNQPDSGMAGFYFSMVMNILIFISSVTFVVETLPSLKGDDSAHDVLGFIETICVAAFTVEFIGRSLVTDDQVGFWKNLMNWIDFIAILPFYVDLFMGEAPIPGLSILRLLRLARVLRLFKVMKTFMSVLSGTVSSSSTPLVMLTFFLSITTVVYSSILYYAERGTYDEDLNVWRRKVGFMCPYVCLQKEPYLHCEYKGQVVDVFTTISVGKLKDECEAVWEQSPFDSIISTFWVITQTMTVVGYGDTEIFSPLGKFIGTCTVLTGILALALPILIIETNFTREMADFRRKALFTQIQKRIKKELA